MAPEAAQQHHPGRRRNLRGLFEFLGRRWGRRGLLGDAVRRRDRELQFFFFLDFDYAAKKKKKKKLTHFPPFFEPKLVLSFSQDRARLESFDRAITCEPQDFPDKREGLAADLR